MSIETTEPLSTAQVLEIAVQAFITREQARYGTRLSKRTITRNFLEGGLEESTLSRWTNPGTHRNWMIPTFRIPAVAKVLASGIEGAMLLHDLMTARIRELSTDEKNEAVVVAAWLAGVLAPTPDETILLRAFQRASKDYPHQILSDKSVVAQFEEFFVARMNSLWEQFWEERAAEQETDTLISNAPPCLPAHARKESAPNAFFKKSKEQRDANYSAKFQATQAIADIQERMGITPLVRLSKRPPR